MSDDINIGDQIRDLRMRRGLTQESLAERAGLSREVVKKAESNRPVRMETYNALARALQVTTITFAVAQSPEPKTSDAQDAALTAIRSAISPPTSISGRPVYNLGQDEPNLPFLKEATHALAMAYHGDRYDTVARLAPAVVRSAHLHVEALDGADKIAARRLRSDALGVAGRYLIQIREHTEALIALRDSLADAIAVGDQSLAAAAVSSQAWAMMRQARFDEVEALCATSADEVEPQISKATPDELSAWGWLLMRASAAAARNNRPSEAREFHRHAIAAAAPLDREHLHTVGNRAFGPLTVALKGPENELILGAPDLALRYADQLPQGSGRTMPSDWNRHGIDKAKALLMVGREDRATEILTKLKDRTPEWLQYQQSARDLTEDIIAGRKRTLGGDLQGIADFLGVQPA